MRTIDRIMVVAAVVCFAGALATAWWATLSDGVWYVPLLLAVASGACTVGALHHRRRGSDAPPHERDAA